MTISAPNSRSVLEYLYARIIPVKKKFTLYIITISAYSGASEVEHSHRQNWTVQMPLSPLLLVNGLASSSSVICALRFLLCWRRPVARFSFSCVLLSTSAELLLHVDLLSCHSRGNADGKNLCLRNRLAHVFFLCLRLALKALLIALRGLRLAVHECASLTRGVAFLGMETQGERMFFVVNGLVISVSHFLL